MRIIGILGGVASGKSVVAGRLKELGAEVLDADVVAHEVLREEDVKSAVRQRFGGGVIGADGEIARGELACIVFAEDEVGQSALRELEAIMHPRIGERLQQRIESIREEGKAKAIVLDAAVMMKANWHKLCDVLLFVEVSPEVRMQRAKSRGWQDGEVAAREARQTPVAEKRAVADVVIDNSGELSHTFVQVDRFWDDIQDSPSA